ncbi:hypothetical protein PLICRDRAFT_110708 [Plicaturopsis crispa FD-325 SS-3]|nr:hypothetical protein PLICRDRAFT_110708 [Plicaturopsis crispa FD-325 SS-3]
MASILRSSARARTLASSSIKSTKSQPARTRTRAYATELPRPPPPTSEPIVETFDSAAKPRPYYARPAADQNRPLPQINNRWPIVLLALVTGVTGWAAFLLLATNQEKVASSVVRQIVRTIRSDPTLYEVLGDAIRPEPQWYLNGDPWISGKVNQLQGNIDVSFRVKGHRGAGTVYFTSIRRAKGEKFQILRFKVIADDGTVVNVPTQLVPLPS